MNSFGNSLAYGAKLPAAVGDDERSFACLEAIVFPGICGGKPSRGDCDGDAYIAINGLSWWKYEVGILWSEWCCVPLWAW